MKMYKTYNIRPKRIAGFDRIPEELQVIFQWQKMKLGADRTQTVTTCLFRNRIKVYGQGFSIENPNDERDEDNTLGIQWAYKRAIKTMLKYLGYKKTYDDDWKREKEAIGAFRTALYKARNKNG
jgi:hypothetical protein